MPMLPFWYKRSYLELIIEGTVFTLSIWTPKLLTTHSTIWTSTIYYPLLCLNPCHAKKIKMPCPLLIFSQSDHLIQTVDIDSHTEWQTVQIQISWLLQKPTDLDLHCLQRQSISGFSRTRVKIARWVANSEDPDETPHSVVSHLGLHCSGMSVQVWNVWYIGKKKHHVNRQLTTNQLYCQVRSRKQR